MSIDSTIEPELLTAEIAAIEDLLVHYEDWRALAQLETRERQGELPSSVASSGIKALLLDKLAANPLFLRRQALLKEVERLAQARAATHGRAGPGRDDADDLTLIRGIDARLARRLNGLGVRRYKQISNWVLDDVRYVSNTLGLDDLVSSQMWIEQASALASGHDAPQAAIAAAMPEVQPAAVLDAARLARQREDAEKLARETAAAKAKAEEDARLKAEAEQRERTRQDAERIAREKAEKERAEAERLAKEKAEAARREQERAAREKAERERREREERERAARAERERLERERLQREKAELEKAEREKAERLKREREIAAEREKLLRDAEAALQRAARISPAKPLPASAYGPVEVPPDVREHAASATEQKPGAPDRPAGDVSAPQAANLAVDPMLELGPLPLPLPARAYAGAAPAPASAAEIAHALKPPAPKPASTYVSSLARAGDILEQSLPPLPLQPAVRAAPAPILPPPSQQQPAAAAERTPPPLPPVPVAAAPAPVGLPERAPPAAKPVTPQVSAAVATAASEAALLAAAAARSAQPHAAAGAPPPLPQPGAGMMTPPAPRPSAAMPPAGQHPHSVEIEASRSLPSSGAPEARVAIRRAEEVMASAIVRVPGGTDVHLPRRPADNFDGRGYAAYHSEIEEASVQIVRKKPAATLGQAPSATLGAAPPDPGPGVSGAGVDAATRSAAEAAARAAAALSGKTSGRPPAQMPPLPPQAMPPGERGAPEAAPLVEKASATMGRFLKALTGQ